MKQVKKERIDEFAKNLIDHLKENIKTELGYGEYEPFVHNQLYELLDDPKAIDGEFKDDVYHIKIPFMGNEEVMDIVYSEVIRWVKEEIADEDTSAYVEHDVDDNDYETIPSELSYKVEIYIWGEDGVKITA